MCVSVCISHTCRNLNFAKNVTTLLQWADDMKCVINSVKDSSSKKKKKKNSLPTYLPYFCSARYANITIFFFWPYRRLIMRIDAKNVYAWSHSHLLHCTLMDIYAHQSYVKMHLFLVCRATTIHAIHVAPDNQRWLAACTGIIRGRSPGSHKVK